ncbi:bifunctional alpha/beta hydrolase/OsmC family protein [Pontimonas sp.]|jgi:putative redox protein|uniref:bifunctional alpha/beta hydrolase/OsmC family protein n=1 Tax=Pontimonas sp. TaxID=2304492 RepID=UPI0028709829|nr:bifunctional alpha/beta hydrolase/OsmC family protein [Pontimonas sp.]MDR9396869.1 bifunctional alpha/beta hydrolase/OsmC family protein [Pontimonas sp.]MDR9434440.1 bifunctional alpha/beta hydrolase/OsmC family protein [Pontimonas sp.]
MSNDEFIFDGSMGPLSGRLSLPDRPVTHSALFAHCFTCSKDIPAAKRITSALAARGIAVLSFDFTGLGHSDGEFENTNFSSNVEDLRAAAAALEARVAPPSLLVGHSLGGAAVIAAAPTLPSVKAVATIGAPSDPEHVQGLFRDAVPEINDRGSAEVDLAGRSFTITKQFVDDIGNASLHGALLTLDAALLVMHSPVDEIVNVSNAAEIFKAALHPKSYVSLDDADHLMRRVADAEYAASVITAWAGRYLPPAPSGSGQSAPDGDVLVSEVSPDGFAHDVLVAGTHQLSADEPEDVGGTNTGPTPYQFLAAGLGACTSMTIRLYARRKKIPLEHVSVTVRHDKRHAIECEGCETTEPKVDHFQRDIRLSGELSDEQVASLLAIADKCPVHRTLERASHISTTRVS